jgi:hypothetical protein
VAEESTDKPAAASKSKKVKESVATVVVEPATMRRSARNVGKAPPPKDDADEQAAEEAEAEAEEKIVDKKQVSKSAATKSLKEGSPLSAEIAAFQVRIT